MKRTLPGEIWQVDFGIAAKVRPALVLSNLPEPNELALLIVVPHTTAVRGNKWEISIPKPFLKQGVFHLQQIQPIPFVRLDRKLGALTTEELQTVKAALVKLLNLRP